MHQNIFRCEIIFSALYRLTHYAVNVLCYTVPFFFVLCFIVLWLAPIVTLKLMVNKRITAGVYAQPKSRKT